MKLPALVAGLSLAAGWSSADAQAPTGAPIPTPARAALAWSTYMRDRPSDSARVIDELEHDRVVTVASCGDRWCQIAVGRSLGYVDRDALMLPRPPPAAASAGATDCFNAPLDGYRAKSVSRFCAKAPGS